ncbi:alpha/beta hydrolase [Actinotalea solisilvae]|uniref:alpha/beta hydrolase n=1 Tax=Actinotalea solisilvae TaxID=2072922 RepID=UPI0018F129B1|nr:dienelactone hydrolase family protein [Actinotalea solisilvae]
MSLASVRSSDTGGTAAPTVLLLHGYGSSEQDLAGLGPLVSDGLPWASLRAPLALRTGASAWFAITTPGSPDPEPVVEATDAIWGWVDAELGPDAVVLPVGFSQGGLMATQLLRTRPERVAATVVLAGFVLGADQPADDVLAAARPRVFWGRGTLDGVIAPHAIERTEAWLPQHATLTERVYPGLGHGVHADEVADVRAFVATATVPS